MKEIRLPKPNLEMDNSKTKVRVNIYGEEYSIVADTDVEYVREVAGYLDRQMREIAEKLSNKSPARVAVLTALNIADELFAERKRGDNFKHVEKRADDMISFLDEKFPEILSEDDD